MTSPTPSPLVAPNDNGIRPAGASDEWKEKTT